MILMNLNSFSYSLLLMLISCVLIFFRLLPLDTLPKDRAYPDLLLCVIIERLGQLFWYFVMAWSTHKFNKKSTYVFPSMDAGAQ